MTKIMFNKIEISSVIVFMITIEIILYLLFGFYGEFIVHSLVFCYLVTAAVIDYKTKCVYRMGSAAFIAFCVCLFLMQPMELTVRIEKILSILVFGFVVWLYGQWNMMGWGDVLTLIGVSFWLAAYSTASLTFEVFLYCVLFSSMIFLFLNFNKINWKNCRLSEPQAFLPSLTIGTLLTFVLIRYGKIKV